MSFAKTCKRPRRTQKKLDKAVWIWEIIKQRLVSIVPHCLWTAEYFEPIIQWDACTQRRWIFCTKELWRWTEIAYREWVYSHQQEVRADRSFCPGILDASQYLLGKAAEGLPVANCGAPLQQMKQRFCVRIWLAPPTKLASRTPFESNWAFVSPGRLPSPATFIYAINWMVLFIHNCDMNQISLEITSNE